MITLNGELRRKFLQIGSQEEKEDPIVVCKFFNPTGRGTWFATEYNPETKTFFGYVSLYGDDCDEWGYFSLAELESFRGFGGLGIELDLFFTPKPFSQVLKN